MIQPYGEPRNMAETKLMEHATNLILDRNTNFNDKPRGPGWVGRVKITRIEWGMREGRIAATLDALLILRDPHHQPVSGADEWRRQLEQELLERVKLAEQMGW